MPMLVSEPESGEMEPRIRKVVETLCQNFPSRNGLAARNLARAAEFLQEEIHSLGYRVESQAYGTYSTRVKNLIVEKIGQDSMKSSIVIGAHYDTVLGTPGADDNASGVAGLLELMRLLRDYPNEKTMHFVMFTLEEPPYFYTEKMGSRMYAKRMKVEKEKVKLMISLEMIGYGGEKLKQGYPFPLMRQIAGYPKYGNFVGVVGNIRTRKLVRVVRDAMRRGCDIGVESLSAPGFLPPLYLSDHSSFWRYGFPALMVTDTAFLRNPHYHSSTDTEATLNYHFLAEVVRGVHNAVITLDKSR